MNFIKTIYLCILKWILISSLPFISVCYASVVVNGTRIIYFAESVEKTIQLTNNDDFPNIVQIWTDTGNELLNIENADGPFYVVPSIFRLNEGRGQSVRLIFNGDKLPNDRESLFYFNFLQIPSVPSSLKKSNRLNIITRHRMKLFYRPINIKISVHNLADKIEASIQKKSNNWFLTIENKSGYYANFSDITVKNGERNSLSIPISMIPPFSKESYSLENENISDKEKKMLVFGLINDYGSVEENTKIIN